MRIIKHYEGYNHEIVYYITTKLYIHENVHSIQTTKIDVLENVNGKRLQFQLAN